MNEDNFLGYIVWYSLRSDILVDLPSLEKFREELDPLIKLPKQPTLTNLWKRLLKTKHKDYTGDVYSFSNVAMDGEGDCVYHYLMRQNDAISEAVGRLVWDSSDDENITIDYLPILSGMELLPVEQTIVKQLQTHMVDHMAVRSVIKDALENKMKAVWLNSGTYFVKSDLNRLNILKKLVNEIDGCQLQVIPLVDNGEQRTMVVDGYKNMLLSLDAEFDIRLSELPVKPSAFKVQKLEKLIDQAKEIEKEISLLGQDFNVSVYMLYCLGLKLENNNE